MPTPTYLAKDRHGGFLFRIKVPKNLLSLFDGSKVIVKSLRTHHRPTAVKQARILAVKAHQIFDQLEMSKKTLSHQLALTKAKLSIKRTQLDDIECGRINLIDGEVCYSSESSSAHQLIARGDEFVEKIATLHSTLEHEVSRLENDLDDLSFQVDHIKRLKLQRKAEQAEGLSRHVSDEQSNKIEELLAKISELERDIKQSNQIQDSAPISELWESPRGPHQSSVAVLDSENRTTLRIKGRGNRPTQSR